jgi:membrane-associated phospholipid phosphatase
MVNLKQHGMFPSGHTMLAAAIYFLIDGQRHPGFKRAAGLLGLAEMITLILSRGHYSIDVAGGVMLAFIVIGWLAGYKERFRLDG